MSLGTVTIAFPDGREMGLELGAELWGISGQKAAEVIDALQWLDQLREQVRTVCGMAAWITLPAKFSTIGADLSTALLNSLTIGEAVDAMLRLKATHPDCIGEIAFEDILRNRRYSPEVLELRNGLLFAAPADS